MIQSPSSQPVVMVITHVFPGLPAAGNEIRIAKLLKWLRGVGFRTVVVLKTVPGDMALALLREQVDEVHWSSEDWPALPEPKGFNKVISTACSLLRKISRAIRRGRCEGIDPLGVEEPDIVRIICTKDLIQLTRHLAKLYNPSMVIAEYIGMSPCLDVMSPRVLKVIDTLDVFSLKDQKVVQMGVNDRTACSAAEERRCLLRADVILAIQSEEAMVLKHLAPGRQVITLGVDFDVIPNPQDSEGAVVIIVASDNPMNIQGIGLFCQEVWPNIRAVCPAAVLRIIGKVGLKLREEWDGVVKVGWVADLDLEYRQCDVVVNPTIAGTGLKIKTVEGLCHGKCVVTWPTGAEGLPSGQDAPFVVAASWMDMSNAIITLLKSSHQRRELENRALAYAQTHCSTGKVYAEFEACLRGRGLFPATSGERQLL